MRTSTFLHAFDGKPRRRKTHRRRRLLFALRVPQRTAIKGRISRKQTTAAAAKSRKRAVPRNAATCVFFSASQRDVIRDPAPAAPSGTLFTLFCSFFLSKKTWVRLSLSLYADATTKKKNTLLTSSIRSSILLHILGPFFSVP